jgi:hypothetical protein
MAPECSHMTTICHFPFWFQWKHLSRLPKLWNFQLVDSKCFQIKLITNKFFFTGRGHFQLSNIRITKRFWLAGDYDYLRGATSINHHVALRANFKIYSRSAKGGEKGDPNRNPWLAKMHFAWSSEIGTCIINDTGRQVAHKKTQRKSMFFGRISPNDVLYSCF